jgi:acyl transferase domain-containing protein/NAD(P)-dependent dehydrogenase (short-subunit alcohol dehydrogenase family)
LVLKGREAGGLSGDEDGLVALANCPEPSRVLLDAGVGPATAAAAAALGAAGVLLVEQHVALPEMALPERLLRYLSSSQPDAITRVVQGWRVANPPTAAVLRELSHTGDPWELTRDLWSTGDINAHLWIAGQGLALAPLLAERHHTLGELIRTYRGHWHAGKTGGVGSVSGVQTARPVDTIEDLHSPGTAANTGGLMGSAVLWQFAAWMGQPITGGPDEAEAATGCPRVGIEAEEPAVPAPQPKAAEVTTSAAAKEPKSKEATPTQRPAAPRAAPAIAIVGIGCHFPKSRGHEQFWDNILNEISAIQPVTPGRWDPELYLDDDRGVPDRTYTTIGGFIDDFSFDSRRFRIPPRVADQVDPVQQLTLQCVADALDDANLKVDKKSDGRPFDRERCAVILGNSLGGEIKDAYAIRLNWPVVEERLRALPRFQGLNKQDRESLVDDLKEAYLSNLPRIDEDSMPGELSNVIAGRIANAFDLGGPNFTVDAACASSMAALQSAIQTLQNGECDLAVSGGADRTMGIASYVKFCKIGALSPDHSSPFDASANGFVMGEGCGIMVLKRYEDAVRDNDKIYAVFRGIGASSDGKGKGITAPNIQGQLRALRRAYKNAGVEPVTVDLIEAHGTSTTVGDKIEVLALNEVLASPERGDDRPVRLGSVKSMIGHLKSAAGAAACIKAALALHHKTYPPSLGFETPREDVPLDQVPLQVQRHAEPWPAPAHHPRRVGVSAFGFGGTNFHVVMEEYTGGGLPESVPAGPPVAQPYTPRDATPPLAAARPNVPAPTAATVYEKEQLPEGLWATSALNKEELLVNLRRLRSGQDAPWNPSAPTRIAAAARDAEDRNGQLDRAIKTLEKGSNPDMLRARAIYFEDAPVDGKITFLFTGQGSQYLNMGLDLAEAYPIVAETFAEANRVLEPSLGKPLTDFIRWDSSGDDKAERSELLRQTEYSQPATLTLDIAIYRLLAAYGVRPDLVAGHSLGEYGAAVASGMLGFEDALNAVSARGREMAGIQLDDTGKMAGIAASMDVVGEVLAEVDGYVIAANKNCPTQTVIAGASDAVEDACERFRTRGVTVYPLPVSHAFHSSIVQPASEPLRRVLQRLGVKPPVRPITTNVTGDYYPRGEDAPAKIIDMLADQISAPVEWISQMERMYDDEARIFVECGPKRALTGFTVAIFKRRPHRAFYTNHPKRGGVASFRDALAGMLVSGVPLRAIPTLQEEDLFGDAQPRRATSEAVQAYVALKGKTEALPDVQDGVRRILASMTGYEADQLRLEDELEADLGIDTVKQAEVFSVVRETYGIAPDPSFSFASYRTVGSLIDWAAGRLGATRITVPTQLTASAAQPTTDGVDGFLQQAATLGMSSKDANSFASAMVPAVQQLLRTAWDAMPEKDTPAAPVVHTPASATPAHRPAQLRPATSIVCSGAAMGLPGGDQVFGPDNVASMLLGENRISHIRERAQRFLELGLVRLVKDAETGAGSFLPVEDLDQVIRLAGTKGAFDLTEWGVPDNILRAYDITTQLAIAAALEALRDAGIPLVRVYKMSASGKKVPQGWALPEPLRARTGIVFASAFPGVDQLIRKLAVNGDDGEGRFDRRLLFQILAMGHSQLAQMIGAQGPNTQVNAACASTTQGVCIAADWIRTGRCDRVLVVGADDVTNEQLLPWIGGGFMAAGAATTKDDVTEAALPFDRRRHGMILGMGAAALVLETPQGVADRGMQPLGELVADVFENSAFHGTRLDIDHISRVVSGVVGRACEQLQTTPSEIADRTLFMSHETYTPARGGSSAAEIAALRSAFGEQSTDVRITNTKGCTGHPMGAGIEDVVAIKALQYGQVPPIANLKQPDPDLMPIRLSKGEAVRCEYALRLAAGFGSQIAVAMWRSIAVEDERVVDEARRAVWLKQNTGFDHVREVVEQRTLRVHPSESDAMHDFRTDNPTLERLEAVRGPRPSAPTTPATAAITAPVTATAASAPPAAEVLTALQAIIAEKTGYSPDEVEADFELEADLGIDTVKQAEILSELTDKYGLQANENFRLADYPTVEALAGYVSDALGGPSTASTAPVPAASVPEVATHVETAAASVTVAPIVTESAPASAASVPSEDVLTHLLTLIAEKTGYDASELEPDFELEADLGIDTVKQAEILADLTAHYGLARDENFRLADYPTIEALAGYVSAGLGNAPTTPPEAPTPAPTPAPPAPTPTPEPAPAPEAAAEVGDVSSVLPSLLKLVADKTGYDVEELEPDFELEADLGIDTVKQAEILADLTEQYGLVRDEAFRLADYPTLEALAGYVTSQMAVSQTTTAPPKALEEAPATASTVTPIAPLNLEPDVIDGHTSDAPAWPSQIGVRRPTLFAMRKRDAVDVAGQRLHVLGEHPDAIACSTWLQQQGAVLCPIAEADTVIDMGGDVMTSFHAAQVRAEAPPSRWITVTRMGGLEHATADLETAHRDGARAGLGKSLAREWPCAATVLDVHPGLSADEVAAQVMGCLDASGAPEEVFVDAKGVSHTVGYADVLPPTAAPYGAEAPVVLITGGGRGISARIAQELAQHGAIKLALVGRTGPASEALDEASEKKALRAQLKAEGKRGTPAEIESLLRPKRKASEVFDTLQSLTRAGANVRFYTCDLADPVAIPTIIKKVTTDLGAIDAVIHGAGVEESRKLQDKDDSAFRRVFDGKAVGGLALLKSLSPDTWFLSMGSVAGRFGNAGQVDYAAANDALARSCYVRGNAMHVDWTAWDDVGMAVRGSMRHLLTERGVELLPADAGASLVVRLLTTRATGELVVSGNLGGFLPAPAHPLLDEMRFEPGAIVVTRALSMQSDPWLKDHAIDGTAVLPGVIGLEMMAAAAQYAQPTLDLTTVRDVAFNAPAKVHHDRVTDLRITARPAPDGSVRTTLSSTRVLRTGRTQETTHFEARFLPPGQDATTPLATGELPDEVLSQEAIYQRFFHGETFQVLRKTLGIASDALIAEAAVRPEEIAQNLLTEPLVLEAAFQAAGLHGLVVNGTLALPHAIASLEMLGHADSSRPFSITAVQREGGYDIDVAGTNGPLMRIRGFAMIARGPLPPEDRFPEPKEGRPTVNLGVQTAHATTRSAPEAWLRDDELTHLRSRGTARRIGDRIAGRIAAKQALSTLTGVEPHQISIPSAESGEPIAVVPGWPNVRVSISHREGVAVAAAVRGGRIGIDREAVEVRPASFDTTWFSEAERRIIAANPLHQTVAWAAKEAVLKALGTGFALSPHTVEILAMDEQCVHTRLRGEALTHLNGHNERELEVRWHRVTENSIEVIARIAA